jgi:hypothetical protein
MNQNLSPISFLYPKSAWHKDMPMVADQYWYFHVEGKVTFGMYSSIIQTYLHLKEAGFPCELVTTMPKEGIVVAHRRSFPFHFRPNPNLLMVCYKANYDFHPYAQLHVLLNPNEPQTIFKAHYIPHWRQTGLIPRNPERGDRFETVAYYGMKHNLAPELRSAEWEEQLKELGLSWKIVEPEYWNDYRDVDAIVAVRNFKRHDYTHKPALKLYNAWHAGIPALLGHESSFQSERKSDLDYLEASSPEELLTMLKHLRDDRALRQAMVENGQMRAQATKPEQLTVDWQNFFQDIAIPAYEDWRSASPLKRQVYLSSRYVALRWREMKEKITQTDSLGHTLKKKPSYIAEA